MPRILVVDDQKENLAITAKTLESYIDDCETLPMSDAIAALELAIQPDANLDLIVTDVKMPMADGFELCRDYKQQCPGPPVPVLLLSGVFVGGEDRARGFEHGADGYLCKPFRIDELIAQVQVLLRIRATEEALRQSETRLEQELELRLTDITDQREKFLKLFEGAPAGICVLNEDGKINQANTAACKLFGRDFPVLEDLPCVSFVTPEYQARFREYLEEVQRGESVQAEVDLRTPLGTSLAVELTGQYLPGETPELILYLRDISRRRAMEQKMQQKRMMEALGRLTGGVDHDFNNLLTSILGFSHIIRDELPAKSDLRADVDRIVHSAEEATNLTRKLMLFGQEEILARDDVDLNNVLRGAADFLRRIIGEDIELVILPDEDLGYVTSDEKLIQQVIIEIATNAREAMQAGGKIVFQTFSITFNEDSKAMHPDARAGEYNVLSVTDEGAGIPQNIRKKIFEPFFTTKEINTRTSGMGLATVYGIVRHAGGFVNVLSQENKGTRIDVYFPVTQKRVPNKDFRAYNAPMGGKETVLVVEDEAQVLSLCIRYLNTLGYNVLQARNGSEALTVANKYNAGIDLLLTDVVMPQMGGPELSRHIAESRPTTKVLFTSGYINKPFNDENIDFTAFIKKPYTRESLARKIREVLDR